MVEILMATYNGDRYLESQINSIISQTDRDWRLLVHDDGSTDNTKEILDRFSHIDQRIFVIEDGIRFGSAGENFMHLIKYASADYIMFSDQDDVWDCRKIELMKSVMQSRFAESPVVVYSSAEAWDGDNILFRLDNNPTTLENTLFNNCGIQGASAMFNFQMLNLMKLWSGKISMHDHLLLLLGLACGKALHCHTVLMKYRKHRNAVTAQFRTGYNIGDLIRGRKDFVLDEKHFETVQQFTSLYWNLFSEHTQQILRDFLILPQKTFLQRNLLIVKRRFMLHGSVIKLLCKIWLRPFCSSSVKTIAG